MGQTLENGVYLPSEGERNCYAGLKTNWEILDQKVADVTALQQAVAGALHREIVASLPTTDIDPNTIYMILSGTSATENVYNEYMYVNNAWELIGTSATDLTNYYTKAEVDGKLLLKANASDLTSHTGDTTIHVTTADKNKWNNQTYVFRYSSTALTASSTNSNTLLDNTDNLKVGDKVIDSSGVLFSITAIDTQSSTFTIGTALIDLAQDSDVVHKSGNEVISGEKNFKNTSTDYSGIKLEGTRVCYITADNANDGVFPANACSSSLLLPDGNKSIHVGRWTSSNNRIFLDKSYPYMDLNGIILKSNTYVPTGETGTATLRLMAQLNFADDTNKNVDVRLTQYDSTSSTLYSNTDNVTSLGSTTKRWSKIYGTEYYYGSNNVEFSTKFVTTDTAQTISGNKTFSSINGVEPSSLSLPDLSNGIDISSYIDVSQVSTNHYTPPANGWISISVISSSRDSIQTESSSGFCFGAYACTNPNNTNEYIASIIVPCVKNDTVTIYFRATSNTSTIKYAKFFPCQGNV